TPILGLALGMATRLSGNRDDAEDLVQETAIQAFSMFDSFTIGTNFKAWFLKILFNRFLNRQRSAKSAPQTVELDEATELYLYDQTRRAGWHSSQQGKGNDPAALLMSKLDSAAISAALTDLPDEFRAVAVLYFMEDFSYEAIAELLDVPIGTVRSRLHRGRKLLQKTLWELARERGIARD
ncbi:MAG TPA: sigma-70 family RNA polymerase sigma factor, partial [Abditibacteriaceae bacterium]